jgi:hypothetical protein
MSYTHTGKFGFEPMRSGDVTGADTLLDGSTTGYTYKNTDRPSYAFKLGPEYNYAQIFFSAGKGFGEGVHEFSAVSEKDCAFALWGYASNFPAVKICDGTVTTGESRIFDVSAGHDASECIACCSITVATHPHPTTINVNDVDSTNGLAHLTLDCLGYEYLVMQFPDVSFPVNAWIRPF